MLLTVAFTFWLASSYVEYRLVKSYPPLQALFNGVPGIIMSLAIGALLAFAVGASNAMPIVLAQMVGLATNDFTYQAYAKLGELNEKRHVATTQVKTFQAEHPAVFNDAVTGIRAGFKTFIALVLGFFWLLGVPVRVYRFLNNAIHSTKEKFSHA